MALEQARRDVDGHVFRNSDVRPKSSISRIQINKSGDPKLLLEVVERPKFDNFFYQMAILAQKIILRDLLKMI